MCVAYLSGTVTVNDSLDLLAEFMGVGDQVATVTNKVGTAAVQPLLQVNVGRCPSAIGSC